MKLNRVLLIFIMLLIFPLTGCLPRATSVIVPTSNIDIDKATEINLKILDLTKMTTSETDQVLGFPLKDIEGAKVIEYRYPVKPIKVKVVKFSNEDNAKEFWSEWSQFVSGDLKLNIDLKKDTDKGLWEFETSDNKILTWQQGLWLTYIEVPNELNNSEDVSYKVKDIIMHHFENLNSDTEI